MNRGELREEIIANIGRDDDPNIETRVNRWINITLIELAKHVDFRELDQIWETETVVSQKRYTAPSRVKVVRSMRVQDASQSQKMIGLLPREFDRLYPFPEDDTEDMPYIYVYYAGAFEFYPIPDGVYTIKARLGVFPQELLVDTQSPDISVGDRAIIAYTTGIGFAALQEAEQAGIWFAETQSILQADGYLEQRIGDTEAKLRSFSMPTSSISSDLPIMEGESGYMRIL
jgi:hypothetical protein